MAAKLYPQMNTKPQTYQKRFVPAILAGIGLMLFGIGCNRAPQTVGLNGQVTFDGQPIESGLIVLEPAYSKGHRRDATITRGVFALPPEQGVQPGDEFKVSIKAFKKTGKKFPGPDPSVTYEEEVQYLPEKYNSASTLRLTVSPNEQENQLKYELTSR